MTMLRLFAAALLLALPALPATAQTYVMRHLNTPAGEKDPDLTAGGKVNAERLVAWFKGKPLTTILVSDFKRTRQTAAPLAAERGITVRVYDPADTPALVALVRAEKGPVLVVGHSNTVPDVVEQLGGIRPAPLVHEDFGDVWTITAGSSRRDRLSDR
jgi:broad specificity phosphatase PhoE